MESRHSQSEKQLHQRELVNRSDNNPSIHDIRTRNLANLGIARRENVSFQGWQVIKEGVEHIEKSIYEFTSSCKALADNMKPGRDNRISEENMYISEEDMINDYKKNIRNLESKSLAVRKDYNIVKGELYKEFYYITGKDSKIRDIQNYCEGYAKTLESLNQEVRNLDRQEAMAEYIRSNEFREH